MSENIDILPLLEGITTDHIMAFVQERDGKSLYCGSRKLKLSHREVKVEQSIFAHHYRLETRQIQKKNILRITQKGEMYA